MKTWLQTKQYKIKTAGEVNKSISKAPGLYYTEFSIYIRYGEKLNWK